MAEPSREVSELTDGVAVLRRPTSDDVEELVGAVRSSLAGLQPWLPWAVDDYDADNARFFLARIEQGEEDAWLIRTAVNDRMVGTVGLNGFSELHGTANLGYWARSSDAGQGWVTRAARLLAVYAFDVRQLQRVEIVMSVENARSRAVAERLDALHEGIRHRALRLADGQHDADVFALLPSDLDRLRADAERARDRP